MLKFIRPIVIAAIFVLVFAVFGFGAVKNREAGDASATPRPPGPIATAMFALG